MYGSRDLEILGREHAPVHIVYNRQPEMDVTIDMTPIAGATLFDVNGQVCSKEGTCNVNGQDLPVERHYMLNAARAGTLRLDGFLGLDGWEDRGDLRVTILRNNAVVYQRDITSTIKGPIDTVPVQAGT